MAVRARAYMNGDVHGCLVKVILSAYMSICRLPNGFR